MKPIITCVIPAHLASKRFPQKMLAHLDGTPLIEYTWRAAQKISAFDHVIVATDSPEIATIITRAGGTALLTSPQCQSATERIIELVTSGQHESDIWINWQGDEPFITADMISPLLARISPDTPRVWTLKAPITSAHELSSPHIVKVITNVHDDALYFSRSIIPYHSHPNVHHQYFKHVGLYAYTQSALQKIATQRTCLLEEYEQLEQLRWLYYGIPITVPTTTHDCIGINTPQDLEHAHAYLASHASPSPYVS